MRQKSGTVFSVKRIGTLQRMVADGRISAYDQISRRDGPWKRIGEIAEMKPFFEAAKLATVGRISKDPVSAGYLGVEPTEHHATMQSPPGIIPEPDPRREGQPTPGSAQKSSHQAPMARPKQPIRPQRPVSSRPPATRTKEPTTLQPPASGAASQPQAVPLATAKPVEVVAAAPAAVSEASAGIGPAAIPSIKRTDPPPGPGPAPVAAAPRPRTPLAVPVERPEPRSSSAKEGRSDSSESVTPAPVPVSGASMPEQARSGPSELPTPPDIREKEEPDFSQIPAMRDEHSWGGAQNGISSAGPAWAERSGSLSRFESAAKPLPARKKRLGRWIVGIIVVGAAAGSFYMFRFQRPMVEGLLGDLLTSADENRYQKFFDRGREAFLLDSEAYYRQADREFQKVLALEEGHAPTLAALAETYAVWAQYLVDEQIDVLADAEEAEKTNSEKTEEAERLGKKVREKIAEASRWADQALHADPALPAAHRAEAEVLRLSGKLDEAAEHLASAGKGGVDPETAYVSVMMDLERGTPPSQLVERLDEVLRQQNLIRAMYRKARLLASERHEDAAKEEIARILELNSEHRRAQNLLDRLKRNARVALRLEKENAQTESEEEPARTADSPAAKAQTQRTAEGKKEGSERESGSTSVASLLKQASRHQKRGRTQNAIRLYERILERDPGHTDALSGLAYCHLDRGASGKAIALFRRVLQNNGRHGPSLIGLATTFKSQGQKELALKYFERYVEAQPSGRQAGLAKRNIEELKSALSKVEEPALAEPAKTPPQAAATAREPASNAGDDGRAEAPVGVELPEDSPEQPATEEFEEPAKEESPPEEAPTPPNDTEE